MPNPETSAHPESAASSRASESGRQLAHELAEHGISAPEPAVPKDTTSPQERAELARKQLDAFEVRPEERLALNRLGSEIRGVSLNDLSGARVAVTEAKQRVESARPKQKAAAEAHLKATRANLRNTRTDNTVVNEQVLSGTESFLAEQRVIHEKAYVDRDTALEAASSANDFRDRAMELKSKPNASAADLDRAGKMEQAAVTREAEVAGKFIDDRSRTQAAEADARVAESARSSHINTILVDTLVKIKTYVENDMSSGVVRSLDGMKDPAALKQIFNDIVRESHVDITNEPYDVVKHGNVLRRNRTYDIFRESTDPEMRGMAFVARVDRSTGVMVAFDVIKAPKPADAGTKAEKIWRKSIESLLDAERVRAEFAGEAKPFQTSKAPRTFHENLMGEYSYGQILRAQGMPYETDNHRKPKKNPRRKGSFLGMLMGW